MEHVDTASERVSRPLTPPSHSLLVRERFTNCGFWVECFPYSVSVSRSVELVKKERRRRRKRAVRESVSVSVLACLS